VAGEVVLAGTAWAGACNTKLGVILPPGRVAMLTAASCKAIGRAPIGLIAPTTMIEHDENAHH